MLWLNPHWGDSEKSRPKRPTHNSRRSSNSVEPTFDEAFQACFFSSTNISESAMFNVVEQAPGEMVQSSRAPIVSKTGMGGLSHTKAVQDTIVQSVLSNKILIVPISDTVGMTLHRVVTEYHLSFMEVASTTVADPKTLIQRSPPRATRPSTIPSDYDSHQERRRSWCHCCRSSHRNHCKTSVSKGPYSIFCTLPVTVSKRSASAVVNRSPCSDTGVTFGKGNV